MSKATASTIKTNNKEIFVERLRNEAADTSFLGVVIGGARKPPRSNSEILNILQNNDGDDFIACPDRMNDDNCRNKHPAYRITKGYFKPTGISYYKSQRQNWIIDAIRTTFLDYDPNIQYDHGDIRKMVWYRYRQARRYVREEDLLRREAARRRRRDDEDLRRCIAARKRAEKEAQQYLDLASKNEYNYYYGIGANQVFITRNSTESNKEWGMRCFNARMKYDQQVKNAKVKENPNEAALVRLRQWMLENPNYGVYGKDLASEQVRFFRPDSSDALTKGNRKRYKVPFQHIHHLLFCLNDQGMGGRVEWNAGKKWKNETDKVHTGLGVYVTMEWPSVNSEGFPAHTQIGYSTTGRQKVNPSGSTWSKLQGNDRTPSPFTMEVCGILDPPPLNGPEDLWKIERNHQLTLISKKSNRVHMMFPKEFSQFEYMNNAKGTLLRECRRFPSEAKITNIKVYVRAQNLILEFLGVTKSPVESEAWKTKVTANHDNIARYFYDLNDPATIRRGEREAKVNDALGRVRATKAANAAAAREAGLRKKRETTVPKPPVSEKIQRLMDLMNLKERGAISEGEFNKLKADLV